MCRGRYGVFTGLAVVALVAGGLFPIANVDTFGHLAQGRYHVAHGLGSEDPFGFAHPEATPATPAKPWRNYEWLFDVVAWTLYEVGGPVALTVAKLLLLAALGALLVRTAQTFGGNLAAGLASALVVWAVPTTRFRLTARPHLVGIALGALYLHGLSSIAREGGPTRRAWRWVGLLALCHVAWVNLHGSHLLGLALTALYAATTLRTPLRAPFGALVGLELVASCISPYGPWIAVDAVTHLLDPAYRQLVPEWAAWSLDRPVWNGTGLYAHLGLGFLALRGLRARAPAPWAAIGAFLLLAAAGVRSLRFAAESVLLTTPLVAVGLAELAARLPEHRARKLVGAFTLAGVLAAVPLSRSVPPHLPFGFGVQRFDLPDASAAWLRAHRPRARVFAAAEDGWYTLFGAPGTRVYTDGRYPFHGVEHARRVRSAFTSPPELRRLLRRYDVDAVLLQHAVLEQRRALETLRASKRYALVMLEGQHALFVRDADALRLEALQPSYEPAVVLGDDVDRAALARDLERLAPYPNASTVVAWVRGLLALDIALADHGRGGPLLPSPQRIDAGKDSLSRLAMAAERLHDVPVVSVYAAMAAVAACDLDAARHWLAQAARAGGTREQDLLHLELALRQGRDANIREQVEQTRRTPGLAQDPWLLRLRTAEGAAARCPGP